MSHEQLKSGTTSARDLQLQPHREEIIIGSSPQCCRALRQWFQIDFVSTWRGTTANGLTDHRGSNTRLRVSFKFALAFMTW